MMKDKSFEMGSKKMSILSALAASSCCVPPLILLGLTLLGVGTAGVAGISSTLGSLKWYILPLAVVGLGSSYFLYFKDKRECTNAACKMQNRTFTRVLLMLSTVVVTAFTAWSVYPFVVSKTNIRVSENSSSAHLAVFEVEGMSCGGCEIAVEGAITATGLIDSVKSNFKEGKAYIWYRRSDVDLKTFGEAISSVGYRSKLMTSEGALD